MMGEAFGRQDRLFYEFDLEDMVPSDHLLRKIDAVLDLSWLRGEMAPHYSHLGCPSVCPELMVRMLIVGYCYSIRSERRLCQEVALNLAYRWFCGLGIEDTVPHHSTFSVNRHGRFRDSDILRKVFEEVVCGCMKSGFVGGVERRIGSNSWTLITRHIALYLSHHTNLKLVLDQAKHFEWAEYVQQLKSWKNECANQPHFHLLLLLRSKRADTFQTLPCSVCSPDCNRRCRNSRRRPASNERFRGYSGRKSLSVAMSANSGRLIYRPPQPVITATNFDSHFVEVPTCTGARTAAAKIARNQSAELQEPASNRFVRNIDATLGQQILDITKRKREPGVEPHRMLDDLGRKTMSFERYRGHTETVPLPPCAGYRLNVSMPSMDCITTIFGKPHEYSGPTGEVAAQLLPGTAHDRILARVDQANS